MFLRAVALTIMLSMAGNGFLPRSMVDLSGNTFLVDAFSCQSIFTDFLHYSDASIVELAVRGTLAFSSVSLSTVRARSRHQSMHKFDMFVTDFLQKQQQKQKKPSPAQGDDTSSDFLLTGNEGHSQSGYAHSGSGLISTVDDMCLTGSRFVAWTGQYVMAGAFAPRDVMRPSALFTWYAEVLRVPLFTAGRFLCLLPRSDIPVSSVTSYSFR